MEPNALILIGLASVILGALLIFFSFLTRFTQQQEDLREHHQERREEGWGVVVIGPIPIIIRTRSLRIMLIMIGIAFITMITLILLFLFI